MAVQVLKHCQVVFKKDQENGVNRKYTYLSNGLDLKEGDPIKVETKNSENGTSAFFSNYIPEEFVSGNISSKVIGKVAVVKNKAVGVRNTIRRTQKQILNDSVELRNLLQDHHPTMLSTKNISELMGWTLEQTPGFVKTAMEIEYKIIQVYRGWYTSKL
jgi:hypothetical protein